MWECHKEHCHSVPQQATFHFHLHPHLLCADTAGWMHGHSDSLPEDFWIKKKIKYECIYRTSASHATELGVLVLGYWGNFKHPKCLFLVGSALHEQKVGISVQAESSQC